MKNNIFGTTCMISFLSVSMGHSASTVIDASNLGNAVFDNSGTALDVGVDVVNGDGDLFEIGYFTGGSSTFSGTWVAITGTESNNPTLVTTIGDLFGQDGGTPVPAGQFVTSTTFSDSVANTTHDLPADSTQLAIRFYDGSSRSGSMYNTVTSSSENWKFKALSASPTPPFPSLELSDTLVWENAETPFMTTIPEPSSFALAGLGSLAFLLRRRR